MAWGEPLLGFADIWQGGSAGCPAEASVHVSPTASARHRELAIQDLLAAAPWVSLEASRRDASLVATLRANGFREGDGPWSVQLWRNLDDLSDLDRRVAPDGYTIRRVDLADANDVEERVEVHRRSWEPARIKTLLGLEVTGTEQRSGYSMAKHEAVMATPVYRRALDLVAAAPDGSLAAYGLGWLDEHHGSVLLEPVGTDPAHGGLGLARAVCAQLLRVARDLGATQAIVGPRGDDRYPLPRRVYEGLGMREVAQFVPFVNASS